MLTKCLLFFKLKHLRLIGTLQHTL